MVGAFIAAGSALMVSILLTPFLIRWFANLGHVRGVEGESQSRRSPRETPTMGGLAIVAAVWLGYLLPHLLYGYPCAAAALLVLGLMTALAAIGLVDDLVKVRGAREQRLSAVARTVGQVLAATAFGVAALRWANSQGLAPASLRLSFVRDFAVLPLGAIGFVTLAVVVVYGWSSAVTVADGLDGLAAGTSGLVLGVYAVIGLWQLRNHCAVAVSTTCYQVPAPLDVAIVAGAAMGGCIGFLWWNASPARMGMGATGSLALGGLIAGLSVVTRTELLLLVIGGVFVVELASVAVQVVVFRLTRRRVFRMAPFIITSSWAVGRRPR